jgi:alkanesulfonate monooxygenase SsuD/methylene tetrahydromethanopterin reductase-like flavin-dependent oxidoreductase (luciferase family)
MKAAYFSPVFYLGHAPGGWPAPGHSYSAADAKRSMDGALQQFALADEVGFDWVTVAEHHYGPIGLTPNPMIFAGALSQVVKRAKIALLGPNIPILNPVRVAEEFAMVDAMTDGRVVAGMLRGTANEYVTYDINPTESRERFDEALQLIRRCWTETQPFGWQGRHFQYRSISIWPRPVQKPHPPMYMSGATPEGTIFAAQHRISLGLAVTTVPVAGKSAVLYREQARLAGWEPNADDVLYRLGFHVAETDEQAMADLDASRKVPQRLSPIKANVALEAMVAQTGYYGSNVDEQRERVLRSSGLNDSIANGQIIIGGPDTVLKQIRDIAASPLKPGILDLAPAFQLAGRTENSIRLLGEKVLPRIREL